MFKNQGTGLLKKERKKWDLEKGTKGTQSYGYKVNMNVRSQDNFWGTQDLWEYLKHMSPFLHTL